MPGFLKATNEWFRIYKIPSGKPENQFAFNGEAKNKAFTVDIIQQTHAQWQALVEKTVDNCGLTCENVSVIGSPYNISQDDAKDTVNKAPAVGPDMPVDEEVDKWHYVKL